MFGLSTRLIAFGLIMTLARWANADILLLGSSEQVTGPGPVTLSFQATATGNSKSITAFDFLIDFSDPDLSWDASPSSLTFNSVFDTPGPVGNFGPDLWFIGANSTTNPLELAPGETADLVSITFDVLGGDGGQIPFQVFNLSDPQASPIALSFSATNPFPGVSIVPEPGSLTAIASIAVTGVVLIRRRRSRSDCKALT